MNIITLVLLILSLLAVNADQICDNFYNKFVEHNCTVSNTIIRNCCDLTAVTPPPGVYKTSTRTFGTSDVYCDTTTGGGGWIVIARNKRGSTMNFNKNWTDYEKGFGDLETEVWYDLDALHCFIENGLWEMRMDYQSRDNTWSYLHYNQFIVGSANKEYLLTVSGFTGIGNDW